jgi:hypothetical protein
MCSASTSVKRAACSEPLPVLDAQVLELALLVDAHRQRTRRRGDGEPSHIRTIADAVRARFTIDTV